MTPVFQTIVDHGEGDCLRACIASILDLGIDDVPNFRAGLKHGDPTPDRSREWLAGRNLRRLRIPMLDQNLPYLCEGADSGPYLVLATVQSQMFENTHHCVVCRINGFSKEKPWIEIVHDPNPNNQPYPADLMPIEISVLIPISS